MYIVVGYSKIIAKECYSTEDVKKIIKEITESDQEASLAEHISMNMNNGDMYRAKDYRITKTDNRDTAHTSWKHRDDGTVECPICGYAPRKYGENYRSVSFSTCLICGTRMINTEA